VQKVLETIEKPCAQVDSAMLKLKDFDEDKNKIILELDVKCNEKMYKNKFEKVRKNLADISDIMRSVNSAKVAVPAFCDILMMYANTESYFTQSETYRKSKSDDVVIRRCDVRHSAGASMDKFS